MRVGIYKALYGLLCERRYGLAYLPARTRRLTTHLKRSPPMTLGWRHLCAGREHTRAGASRVYQNARSRSLVKPHRRQPVAGTASSNAPRISLLKIPMGGGKQTYDIVQCLKISAANCSEGTFANGLIFAILWRNIKTLYM